MIGKNADGLLTLEDAFNLSQKENLENHKNYINPELANLLKLLNFDKMFTRAKNCSVWDMDGNEYLDFLGGYGALNLGHNNSEVIEAVKKADDTPNILQISLSPLAGALARNLSKITPGDLQHCFFGNSGAEAVEGALKLARASTGKHKIVSCCNSFHGKSFGALSVTGKEKYQSPFEPLLLGVAFVPFGDAKALELALKSRDVAAFIVEPLQGEGGIQVPDEGYLKEARRICTETETLLIVDEVQTGFGRTGKMFACEYEGIAPDIMCMAKSLGGGVMPLSAYITTKPVWERAYGSTEKATLHTSTFGGNSRAMSAGLRTLEVLIRDDLANQAAEKGEYFLNRLKKIQASSPIIKDVRGKGLMIGIEFSDSNSLLSRISRKSIKKIQFEYMTALIAGELLNKHNIITAYTLNNPSVIRIEPPLTVTYEQMDKLADALEEVCRKSKSFSSLFIKGTKTVVDSLIESYRK